MCGQSQLTAAATAIRGEPRNTVAYPRPLVYEFWRIANCARWLRKGRTAGVMPDVGYRSLVHPESAFPPSWTLMTALLL